METLPRLVEKLAKKLGYGKYGYVQVGSAGEVAAIPEVGSSHHVLRVIHLLSQLGNGNGAERVSTAGGERSKADHEEVETREGNHVDGKFPQVGVELARETQTGGDTRHDSRDKVVEITIRRRAELESPHANVVQSLVIDTESLVGVLNYNAVSKSRVNATRVKGVPS